jgi:hypothetical protein
MKGRCFLKEVLWDPSVNVKQEVEYALARLGRVIEPLIETRWSEPLRNLAEALAEVLVKACRRARLRRAMRTAQALQDLLRLEPEDLILLPGPPGAKLIELLSLVRHFVASPQDERKDEAPGFPAEGEVRVAPERGDGGPRRRVQRRRGAPRAS